MTTKQENHHSDCASAMPVARIILQTDEILFDPIPPRADSQEIADAGERLMYRTDGHIFRRVKLFVAARGILTAGWVIGLIKPGGAR